MSQIQVPNNFSQILTICRYELLMGIQGKKIPGILAITIGVAIALLVVPEILGGGESESVSQYLMPKIGFGFFLLIITAALFGSSSLVTEFHERTGYSLFPNPVSKTTIWFGKFLAAEILGLGVISIFYGIISIGAYSKFNKIPLETLESFLFSFVVLTMLMSLSFLISSFSRGPTGAVVIVFLLFMLVFPIVDQFVMNLAEIKPWFSPTFMKGIVENVMTVPYPLDLIPGEFPRGPFDFQRFVPYIEESLLVMFVYIVTFSVASIYIFKQREMK